MSNRRIYGEDETQDGAAGSEFGKKQREEARRKKYGIVTSSSRWRTSPGSLKLMARQEEGTSFCFYPFLLIDTCFVLHFSEFSCPCSQYSLISQ